MSKAKSNSTSGPDWGSTADLNFVRAGAPAADAFGNALVELTQKIRAAGGAAHESKGAFDTVIDVWEKGSKVVGIAKEIIGTVAELHDRYVNIENSARRFADATHSVTEVMAEQTRLAHELHVPLEKTVEVYGQVREASEGLNLTHEKQIRATQTLGEAAVLSGKSFESSGQILARLSAAFDVGVDHGASLRELFKEYPALADHLSQSLGLSSETIIGMADNGEISFNKLGRALSDTTDDIDKKFGERSVTWSQRWEEFKDSLTAPISLAWFEDQMQTVDQATAKVVENLKQIGAQYEHEQFEAGLKQMEQGLNTVINKMIEIKNSPGWQLSQDYKFSLEEARTALMHLNAAHKAGVVVGKDYQRQYESLMTTLNHGELPASIRLWNQIHEPMERHLKDVNALNRMFGEGKITFEQYDRARRQAEQAYAATTDEGEMLQRLHGPREQALRDQELALTLLRQNKITQDEYNDELERTQAILERPVKSVTGGKIQIDSEEQDRIAKMALPIPEEEGPKLAEDKKAKSGIDPEKTKDALESVGDKAEEEAKRTKQAWTQASGSIAGNFVKAALEGKKSFGEMVEDALTKLALLAAQQAAMQMGGPYGAFFGSVLGALGGGASGFDHVVSSKPGLELPGFAHGGDFTVGGTGGIDSKIAMFRVTPGESVHVRTPEQQTQASGRAVAAPRVQNVIQVSSDPREVTAAMGSYSGQREFVKLNRKFKRRN